MGSLASEDFKTIFKTIKSILISRYLSPNYFFACKPAMEKVLALNPFHLVVDMDAASGALSLRVCYPEKYRT